MKLRVLHIGNIANNAYNIAKALRERTQIEADVFTHGYNRYISQPEWEDADIQPIRFSETESPDWSNVDLNGFERPEWYFENLDFQARNRLHRLPAKDMLRTIKDPLLGYGRARRIRHLLAKRTGGGRAGELLQELYEGLAPAYPRTLVGEQWHRHLIRRYQQLLHPPFVPLTQKDIHQFVKNSAGLRSLFGRYDIIQAYGVWEPMLPLLLSPSIPRVTFEHGSMREHPFQDNALGKLLALSYKTSHRNILTNADSVHAMRRLGLTNCTFIPHPVDDEKFRPFDSPLRERLLAENNCTQIIFSVARHNWAVKGNDKVIHGFALLKERLGKGPKLFLADWGQEMERSRVLIRQLKLEDDIVWLPPLPKRCLADYVNASDVVLDQFILGCFGTTTPEAMACGKPVILYYRPEDHEWCFPEHAPILNAYSAEDIAVALEQVLTDPEQSRALGQRAREWFLRHHSLDLVVQRHMEIYRAIADSKSTTSVPKQRSVSKQRNREMSKGRVVAVVRCSDPVDAQGNPKYLKEICGVSLMETMASRLQKTAHISHAILLLDEVEPQTVAAAKRLGWSVVLKNKRRLRDVAASWHLARCNSVALFNLQQPFVDSAVVDPLLDMVCSDGISVMRVREGVGFAPSHVIKRNFAARVFLLKAIMRRTSMSWRQALETLLPFVATAEQSVSVPSIATEFTADSCSDQMVEAVGGIDFGLDDLRATARQPKFLAKIIDKQRKTLHRELASSSSPHVTNQQLNELDCKLHSEELLSFPTFVGLNMTSTCNARCVFCSYQPSMLKQRDYITLEDIKKMTWLKYVKDFAIWGGIGDSLVNPEFLDCYRYLKNTFGHLRINLSTNGIRMNRELCDEFVGHLSSYNVSLNAARKETWEKLMRSKGFDNICDTYAYLSRRKRELGVEKPTLTLSMVLTKDNIEEAVEFAELAHRLGAETATYVHYVSTTLLGSRDLAQNESLYFAKEKADEWLEKAEKRCKELGLNITRPLPFHAQDTKICYGARTAETPQPCADPWKTCYLTVDEEGQRQMIFCCSGFYYAVTYDKSDLGEEEFKRVWNHPAAQYFRRTVNKKGVNPICSYCQSVDRFDPQNNPTYYQIGEKVDPIFLTLNDKVQKGELTQQDALLEAGPMAPQAFLKDAPEEGCLKVLGYPATENSQKKKTA